MTEDIRKSIVENIAKKIVDSGNTNDVGEFLGQLTFITPLYFYPFIIYFAAD